MKMSECSHLRIRDNNAYGVDVEEFIKSIEKQYGIDFRSLPQWQELVKRMYVITTALKRKVQDAKRRKYVFMSKIFIEATRDSPFELTDKLARTSKKWQMLEHTRKFPRRVTMKDEPVIVSSRATEEIIGEISENTSTAHHNTEIPDLVPDIASKSEADTDTRATDMSQVSHLPTKICVNQHKRISSLGSEEIVFDFEPAICPVSLEPADVIKEWLLLNQTTSVKCFPKELIITSKLLKEQTIQFSVVNCTTKYMNIRFMCLTDTFYFKRAKVVPATPKKLYPGIEIKYKFIFKLLQNLDEFMSTLYFRVGQKVLEEAPVEALCIPVISKFRLSRSASVTELVYTPPTYLWQIRKASGFPSGTLEISGLDEYSYHVHIVKRLYNISRECQDSVASRDVIGPTTESLIDRMADNEIETQSKILVTLRETQMGEVVSVQTADIIALVVEDLMDLALDTFVFDYTYLFLKPHAKQKVAVSFTKAEHIGSHHCYYDIEFYDVDTEELIITKTVKVFADVLPHPIEIYPNNILDMSISPVIHGYCEDDIIIKNAHKVYPVTVKFKLTTKMRKLFCIIPMESSVPAKSSSKFRVRLCSKDLTKKSDDLAHFTLKVIISGHKFIYDNVPPIFYEIIAPCGSEFKKIYNSKYFIDFCE